MKLKYPFEIMEIDDGFVAVPVSEECNFFGVLRVNKTAAQMLKLLSSETDEKTVINSLKETYLASEEELSDSLNTLLETLRSEELITE